jgi:hypothetical protein
VQSITRDTIRGKRDAAMIGFLNGVGYDGTPLEINAYDLGGRFERSPRTRFSVEDEVGMWVGEHSDVRYKVLASGDDGSGAASAIPSRRVARSK